MKLSLSLFLGFTIFSTHVIACASPGDPCVLGDAPVQCECNGGHLVSLALLYVISCLIPESAYSSASAYPLTVLVPRFFLPLHYTSVIPTNQSAV